MEQGQGIGDKVQSACKLASHWKKGESPLHTNLISMKKDSQVNQLEHFFS